MHHESNDSPGEFNKLTCPGFPNVAALHRKPKEDSIHADRHVCFLTSPIFVGEIPMFIVGLVQPTHLSSTPNSIHPPQGFSEILEISTTSRSSWRSPGSRTCRWRCRRARRTAPRCCCEPPRAPSVPRRR